MSVKRGSQGEVTITHSILGQGSVCGIHVSNTMHVQNIGDGQVSLIHVFELKVIGRKTENIHCKMTHCRGKVLY